MAALSLKPPPTVCLASAVTLQHQPLAPSRRPALDRHHRLRAPEVLRHQRDQRLVGLAVHRHRCDARGPGAVAVLGEFAGAGIGFDQHLDHVAGHGRAQIWRVRARGGLASK